MTEIRRRAGLPALWLLVGLAAGPADGAPPPAPFELRLGPSVWREGEPATISVRPLGRKGAAATDEPVDVYLVRIPEGPAALLFLDSTGAWSVTPTAYRAAVPLSGLAPIAAEWRETGPPGKLSVAVGFVRASRDPFDRKNWVFEPLIAPVRVRSGPPDVRRTVLQLGSLGLLTLAAILVVVRYRGGADPPERSPRR